MLRPTFVTTMLDAGVSLGDVQIAARHHHALRPARKNLDRTTEALALGEEAIGVARQALGTHRAAGLGGLADALLAQARRLNPGPGRNKADKRRASELRRQADKLRAQRNAVE